MRRDDGIYRSDRVSGQTLYYLMSTNNIPVDDSKKKTVTLESLLNTVDHWSGKKKEGYLICYAEDANTWAPPGTSF